MFELNDFSFAVSMQKAIFESAQFLCIVSESRWMDAISNLKINLIDCLSHKLLFSIIRDHVLCSYCSIEFTLSLRAFLSFFFALVSFARFTDYTPKHQSGTFAFFCHRTWICREKIIIIMPDGVCGLAKKRGWTSTIAAKINPPPYPLSWHLSQAFRNLMYVYTTLV